VAGPGSGKTRVLLWRTFNLIVFHAVEPRDIFLSTFTEKAARQLKDGLLTLLASVNGRYFDISEMYVGTVHSLCRRILTDRRFNPAGTPAPELMDKVEQYFHVYASKFWLAQSKTEQDVVNELKPAGWGQSKRHSAAVGLISLFNRLSEECINPAVFKGNYPFLGGMYEDYLHSLNKANKTDMSLLQQRALDVLKKNTDKNAAFKYLLIDEYQDTNTVQEHIFFNLAAKTKNLCVVGDDDQALFRFRGATVENLVRFPDRCVQEWNIAPYRIDLNINYRSCPQIVEFYNQFIITDTALQAYRVPDKTISANRACDHTAVVVTASDNDLDRCEEIAVLVKTLLDSKKVADPNQIAFLYPSVKKPLAKSMIDALAKQGLPVYSPRSGLFLDCEEAKVIFGLMLQVLGRPDEYQGGGTFKKFNDWLDQCEYAAHEITSAEDDEAVNELKKLIASRTNELNNLGNNQATNWNLLDLFYQFCSIETISIWLAKAERGGDEGPACNLSLISQYLFRYQQMHDLSVISRSKYGANGASLRQSFFTSYLYGLYRLEESEYEDSENPFPKGRIPFLTIHQAKGLEFPVVVLGSIIPFSNQVTQVETLARSMLPVAVAQNLEPLTLIGEFDAMRMFYVALSRAENLLIIANTVENGATDKRHPGLRELLDNGINGTPICKINALNLTSIPVANNAPKTLPKIYSYTADYQYYLACPRQYMLFRKYGFAPSRTRTMAFGILVHKTIEDIHRGLIVAKQTTGATTIFIGAMAGFIDQRIKDNYQVLSKESSHKLAPHTLAAAHDQVVHYWNKLGNLAQTITDTEVPLTLPGQTTPNGIIYSLHGVVDMAKEVGGNQSHLYDIKTHDADSVRAYSGYYQEQLNVYAHIWQTLHGQTLSGTSIIATRPPSNINALAAWNPVVPLPFNSTAVAATINHFGEIVDCIETRQFQPRAIADLPVTSEGERGSLFDEVCSNCDGRFSCSSYAGYLEQNPDQNPVDKPIILSINSDYSEAAFEKLGHLYLKPDKAGYLNDTDVQGFIKYLSEMVKDNDPQPLNHSYLVEPVNQHFFDDQIGECVHYSTIRDAFDGYAWKKQGYPANQLLLNGIANNLQTAITENDLYKACLDCLAWGAGGKQFTLYTANRDWLWVKKSQTLLSTLFDDSHAQLSNIQPDLIGFKHKLYRMNSGFTKIYALKYPDFIIYDSRVAAALGLLVHRYCQDNRLNQVPANLAFHWSGTQKRNPSFGNYQFSRLNNDSKKHAEWNIKANWVLNAVVARTAENKEIPFWGVSADQCLRALEASLFMVGYSVIPCAGVENPENIQSSPSAIEDEEDYDETSQPTLRFPLRFLLGFLWNRRIRQGIMNNNRLSGGWVPTSHVFTTALRAYLNYRLGPAQPKPPTSADFEIFMKNQNIARGIAQNQGVNQKLYVQNQNEFNLNNQPIQLIQSLWNSQSPNGITRDALEFLNQYRQLIINSLATQSPEDIWNYFPKYLMDTYLCGQLVGYTNNQKINILEGYRYAGIGNGKGNTTNAILTVGRSFGTHFGFLDENYYPTVLYRHFFLTTLPLANWIDEVTII
jgi:DNA helicase-2/ATP-dependent DNA helicase PcrA